MSRNSYNPTTDQLTPFDGWQSVDNSLSTTSHNPVQNDVITAAIGNVEKSIAPQEDGTTLSQDYSIGEPFYRGNVLYKAKTTLTSGTAWTNLVLNTNYELSDSITEQLEDVASDIETLDEHVDSLNEALSNKLDDEISDIDTAISENGAKNLFPLKAISQVIDGITFSVNTDITSNDYKAISVGGTASAIAQLPISDVLSITEGLNLKRNLRATGIPQGAGNNIYMVFSIANRSTGAWIRDVVAHEGAINITLGANEYIKIGYLIVNVNTVVTTPVVVKPMITVLDQPNSDYAHYVPYAKTNRELTEDVAYIVDNEVSINDCSDIDQICTKLMTSSTLIGYGSVGTLNTNNLKTLLGDPNIGNYARVTARLLGKNSKLVEFVAVETSAGSKFATKYAYRYSGGSAQTAWTVISKQA